MPAGIEIRRDAAVGRLLLTTNLANPILRQSGNVTTVSAGGVPGATSKAEISYTGSATSKPMCCLRPAQGSFLWNVVRSSNTWTWTFYTAYAIGSNIPYYVFDEPNYSGTNNFGIELYADAVGSPLLFRVGAGDKPLRIEAVLTSTSFTDVTFPSGRTYAACQGLHMGKLIWEPGAQPPGGGAPDPNYFALTQWSTAWRFDPADTLKFSDVRMDAGPSTLEGTLTPDFGEERYWDEKQLLILDVTGY